MNVCRCCCALTTQRREREGEQTETRARERESGASLRRTWSRVRVVFGCAVLVLCPVYVWASLCLSGSARRLAIPGAVQLQAPRQALSSLVLAWLRLHGGKTEGALEQTKVVVDVLDGPVCV